jgi:hypothetical protein
MDRKIRKIKTILKDIFSRILHILVIFILLLIIVLPFYFLSEGQVILSLLATATIVSFMLTLGR